MREYRREERRAQKKSKLSQPLKLMGESQAREHRRREAGIIALDPGVRTFMTTYNGCGEVTEWGKADINEIGKLCHRLDRMQSKGTKVNHRQRRRLRRAAARLRQRIRNLVDDLHKKLVSWLVRNFSLILLPEFRSQQMVRRGHRRIGSRTARAMLTWSHYRFRQRLLNKAQQFPSCTVCLCDEEYTSKTCGKCGQVHHQLGGNKTFRCPQPECGYQADRDANAARNILIRFFTLQALTTSSSSVRGR